MLTDTDERRREFYESSFIKWMEEQRMSEFEKELILFSATQIGS